MEDFLEMNKIGHLLPNFEAHSITTLDLLAMLSEDHILKLIPTIGDQIRFKQGLQILQSLKDLQPNNQDTAKKRISEENREEIREGNQEEPLEEPQDKRRKVDNNENTPDNEQTVCVFYVNPLNAENPSCSTSTTEQPSCPSIASTLTDLKNDNCGVNSSFLSTFSFDALGEFNIKAILESDAIGRVVLSKAAAGVCLVPRDRNIVCEIITSHFINKISTKLHNDSFSRIADSIVDLFPNERKSTYFVSPIRKKDSTRNKPEVARGKLVDKYRNKLTQLRRATEYNHFEHQSPNRAQTSSETEPTREQTDSKIWLKLNSERSPPTEEILRHWKNSCAIRQIAKKSIEEFYDEWPTLESQLAVELIPYDFSQNFNGQFSPVTIDELDTAFDELFSTVIEKRKRHLSPADQVFVSALNTDALTTDSKVAIKLHLLASLLPPKSRTRLSQKNWKPSITECRDGLLAYIASPGDLESKKTERVNLMYRRGLTVQPYILLVGSSLTNITSSYVIINTHTYQTISVLDALDFCFKSYHVLDAQYPFECQHIWHLVQLRIYKLKTKHDKKIPFIQDLLG